MVELALLAILTNTLSDYSLTEFRAVGQRAIAQLDNHTSSGYALDTHHSVLSLSMLESAMSKAVSCNNLNDETPMHCNCILGNSDKRQYLCGEFHRTNVNTLLKMSVSIF